MPCKLWTTVSSKLIVEVAYITGNPESMSFPNPYNCAWHLPTVNPGSSYIHTQYRDSCSFIKDTLTSPIDSCYMLMHAPMLCYTRSDS